MLFREEDEDDETLRFEDRAEAGRILANKLSVYSGRNDVIVLELPRGGVPVAFQVAQALNAPLDVFVVRKLGTPWNRELAIRHWLGWCAGTRPLHGETIGRAE